MKTKKILFFVYALSIIIVPLYVILKSEAILTDGHLHKIRLGGFDPMDPFRGDYIQLNFNNRVSAEQGVTMGSTAFVTLEKDSLGFSQFKLAKKKSPSHSNYIAAKVTFIYERMASLDLDNMNKYFINEDMASEAGKIIADYSELAPEKIWLNVRVLDGEARIEDIIVKKMKLIDYIRSGKHRTFREDIEREYRKQLERKQRRMEREMREQLRNLQTDQRTIEFVPPTIDDDLEY